MRFIKTEGIVLKEIDTGDADKIVILLTPDHGKITVSAAGAKRPRNKFVGCTEFLCYSGLDLFKTKDNYRINEARIIESFYEIRKDVIKLAYASYFSEILNDIVLEEHISKKEIKLFLNCLHYIASGEKDSELIACIFELRILTISGMAPYLEGCLKCGCDNFEEVFFSFKEGGIICKACTKNDETIVKMFPGTYNAMRYIINEPLTRAFSFSLSDEVNAQLRNISKKFLSDRLEKKYKSREFLERIIS